MIIVCGHLIAHPGQAPALVQRSATAVSLARSAPGCLDFAVSPDTLDPDRVNVLERWTDRESLDIFRSSGPDDGTGALILDFAIDEFDVR